MPVELNERGDSYVVPSNIVAGYGEINYLV